jgi:hypothetical protein
MQAATQFGAPFAAIAASPVEISRGSEVKETGWQQESTTGDGHRAVNGCGAAIKCEGKEGDADDKTDYPDYPLPRGLKQPQYPTMARIGRSALGDEVRSEE